ncbi:gustatory and odorant receptor 22-like [Diprion similis]|uniref:gustatory and odorant receptor 22-like n=1 Tax=Diprion similis TaxID=362088 RepID=UPI001EF98666|nr:gustatory and odorant receptor 22-like [Diprion similis]
MRRTMKRELTESPFYLDVRHYRMLWMHIYELIEKMSSSVSRIYGLYSLVLYMNLFVAVYCTVSKILSPQEIVFTARFVGFVVCMFYFSIHLYVVSNSAYNMHEEMTNAVRNDLLDIRLDRLSKFNAKEVEFFLDTINARKVGLVVSGNLTIRRKTVIEYASSVAMYCLVLLQFKIALPRT